jgi:hypothetical protein
MHLAPGRPKKMFYIRDRTISPGYHCLTYPHSLLIDTVAHVILLLQRRLPAPQKDSLRAVDLTQITKLGLLSSSATLTPAVCSLLTLQWCVGCRDYIPTHSSSLLHHALNPIQLFPTKVQLPRFRACKTNFVPGPRASGRVRRGGRCVFHCTRCPRERRHRRRYVVIVVRNTRCGSPGRCRYRTGWVTHADSSIAFARHALRSAGRSYRILVVYFQAQNLEFAIASSASSVVLSVLAEILT